MKWDRMRAYIGAPQGFVPDDDGEHEGFWQGYTEFYMQVLYRDQVFYNKIMVHTDELKQFPGLYKLTLDKMVEGIDNLIKEKFPVETKRRSTTVTINRDDCYDEETTRLLIRSKVQPWLDELHKDELEISGMAFEIVENAQNYLQDTIEVTVSVQVQEKLA